VGYPISESQGVRFGLTFQKQDLLVTDGSSAPQAIDWVVQNGNARHDCLAVTGATVDCSTGPVYLSVYGTN